jgi:hypothetical protein
VLSELSDFLKTAAINQFFQPLACPELARSMLFFETQLAAAPFDPLKR